MKILIYGQSKSGTTILHARVKAAFRRHVGAKVLSVFEPRERVENGAGVMQYCLRNGKIVDERQHTQVKALFARQATAPRGIYWDAALAMFEDFHRRIFVIRDPRDRLISGFFYRWYFRHDPDPASFNQALQRTRFKEEHPADLPFYCLHSMRLSEIRGWARSQGQELKAVKEFLEQVRTGDWHVMHYEAIVDQHLDDLDGYLGFEVDRDVQLNRNKQVVRSKRYGSWRQWFTEEDVEVFRPVFEPYLELLGYDPDDWQLEPVESLPASEGSEYMTKISRIKPDPDPDAPTLWQRLRRRFG